MYLFNFPCLLTFAYFVFLYSSDGNDAKRNMFSAVDCWIAHYDYQLNRVVRYSVPLVLCADAVERLRASCL